MALVQRKCLNQLKHLYKYDNSGIANRVFSDFFFFFDFDFDRSISSHSNGTKLICPSVPTIFPQHIWVSCQAKINLLWLCQR